MKTATRLFAILARKSPYAVIFRRGPSRSVLLIRWNTETDTFEHGQWLRGRIYERRCDLSPDGGLLLYFAANWHPPFAGVGSQRRKRLGAGGGRRGAPR